MRASRRCCVAVFWVLAGGPLAALAQSAPNAAGIYACTDDKGRRLTSDRPIPECINREQRLLNPDGSVRAVRPPSPTAEERAEKEAREHLAAEAKAAQADAVRRDRNLMARFPNEAIHQRSREAALDTVRLAIKATELRLRDLANARKPLMAEAEFYVGKPLPAKLRLAIEANDAAMEAQRSAVGNQSAELDRINRLFDAELARLRALWSGTPPGSLGMLPQAVALGASSASSASASAAGGSAPKKPR